MFVVSGGASCVVRYLVEVFKRSVLVYKICMKRNHKILVRTAPFEFSELFYSEDCLRL